MCRSKQEPGGPRRCAGDARAVLSRAQRNVRVLSGRASELAASLEGSSPDLNSDLRQASDQELSLLRDRLITGWIDARRSGDVVADQQLERKVKELGEEVGRRGHIHAADHNGLADMVVDTLAPRPEGRQRVDCGSLCALQVTERAVNHGWQPTAGPSSVTVYRKGEQEISVQWSWNGNVNGALINGRGVCGTGEEKLVQVNSALSK
ncbi:Uncharacterised protein [Mycolicibacterium fortuitum]|uniref:Uncharacterized protein n=1 Tax=Mycolicibacterium fortuitum TaxID=1766 RepID=A0A378WEJ9_MYCFO|nr:Uncharacterised protein [Mycolicibacterium fortuitum]